MDAAVDAPAACAVYRRRRPARTSLYQSVQGNRETYLALARHGHPGGDGVPQYVERELRRYLECAILAHGFARARCAECSHDFLIAFSCKGRGYAKRRNMRSMDVWRRATVRFFNALRHAVRRSTSHNLASRATSWGFT